MTEKEHKALEEIRVSLNKLSRKIDKQEERINRLEKENKMFRQGPEFPEDKLETRAESREKEKKKKREGKEVKEKIDWEEKLGGQWFAKIGIAILIIGIALFLKYAFDNNWIGETGRVVIGLIVGLGLLVWGEKIIKKFFLYGQIISGGGLVILYLSVFVAFNFYELISASWAFPAMIIVTALGVILSLRYNALSLLSVVIIGGFATPFLVSTGENQQVILFSYVLLLNLAVLIVSVFKRWHLVNLLAFLGTIITSWVWLLKFYNQEQLLSTILFFTLLFLVYSLSSLIYNLINREKSTGVEQILTLLTAFFYFGAFYWLLEKDFYSFLSFFAVILGVYYFLWAYFVRQFTPEDKNLYHFLAFLTIGFITLSVPIEFKKYTIAIVWAVEAVLLIGLAYI